MDAVSTNRAVIVFYYERDGARSQESRGARVAGGNLHERLCFGAKTAAFNFMTDNIDMLAPVAAAAKGIRC